MAGITSVDIRDQHFVAHLKLSRHEYNQLAQTTDNILILPSESSALTVTLTTGKLGNGNRIMIPKKLLKAHNMDKLPKKVPANVFYLDEDKYLLIKLKDSKPGVPVFSEDIEWKK